MSIVRENRKKPSRRVPTPGAGVRRSEIRARENSNIIKTGYGTLTNTEFGKREVIVTGAYEIELEVMAPHASTGFLLTEEGSVTIMGRTGILHLHKEIEDGPNVLGQVRPGEFVTLSAGDTYSLSTGDLPCDFMRIQTPDYREGVVCVTAPLIPADTQVNILAQMSASGTPIVSPEARESTSLRKSNDADYRAAIAARNMSDKRESEKRRGVTREVRQARSAEQVMPHTGQQFKNTSNLDNIPIVALGFNPRPIGAAMAGMIESEAASQVYIPESGGE